MAGLRWHDWLLSVGQNGCFYSSANTPENPGTPGGGSGGGSDNGSGGSSGDGSSKGGMPDTGDRSLPAAALAVMAGIGALTAAGGAVLYRRRR